MLNAQGTHLMKYNICVMEEILVKKTKDRAVFIKEAFAYFNIQEKIRKASKILLKPNIVSSEPYPTTTHPEVLRACLKLLLAQNKKVLVADGPAFNAGPSQKVIENHPLAKVCQEFQIKLINLNQGPFTKIKTKSFTFHIASLALESDFIISLPVFKSHSVCFITGALKNQYGLLSPKDKAKFHLLFWKNIHQAIAELNQAVRVNFWIVDLVETLISAQEVRHGGQKASIGFMLAGAKPVVLDTKGFEILKTFDPKLQNKKAKDIPQIKFSETETGKDKNETAFGEKQ